MSVPYLRLHIDIAYYVTCLCVAGLAIERYILVCHYSDAKTILTKRFRAIYSALSLLAAVIPVLMKLLEQQSEPWLGGVNYAPLDPHQISAKKNMQQSVYPQSKLCGFRRLKLETRKDPMSKPEIKFL